MQRIIKHQSVRRVGPEESSLPKVARPTEASPQTPTPGVRVHRADGRVCAVEVTCACGETTLIELAYDEKHQ